MELNNEKIQKYKTKKSKKLAIVSVYLSMLVSLSSCMDIQKKLSEIDDSSSEASADTIDTSEQFESQTSSEYPTTQTTTISSEVENSQPTGIEASVGETLPTVEFENPSGFPIFDAYRIAFGGLEFGFDNHKYLDNIRQYYNDDSLNFYDLGYLQEYLSHRDMLRYTPHRDDADKEWLNFQRQIALYILYKLDCRLYVDEIPDEFFDTNFDDYLKELENTGDPNYDAKTGTEVLYESLSDAQLQTVFKSKNIDEFIANINDLDEEQLSRLLVFFSSFRLNQRRLALAYDYHTITDGDNYTASYINQVRTPDGKNVLLFKQYQYDAFLNDVHDQDCFKEIADLYTPITEDDLIKAGIDVDKFEYVVVDVAGIDFDLENVKDGTSRAKTS